MSFNYGLSVSLDEWAASNGWRVLHIDERGLPNRITVEFTCAPMREEGLPPLGVKVSEKIAAKERLGGG